MIVNPNRFQARHNAFQAITSSFLPIQNWVKSFDPSSVFNAATGVFTPTTTAWYTLSYNCSILVSAGEWGHYLVVALYGNNVLVEVISRVGLLAPNAGGVNSSYVFLGTAGIPYDVRIAKSFTQSATLSSTSPQFTTLSISPLY